MVVAIQDTKETDLDLSEFTIMDYVDYSSLASLLFKLNLLQDAWEDTGYEVICCGKDLWIANTPESEKWVKWENHEKALDIAKKIYLLFN